ncbi:hypothetical protein [Companilactobacillus muriivasis]|uniref:hypothetical protein n=1 Tax=Companilactobacillus muriivasis TaxID=3081444 RepID=UPI0030C7226E
MKMPAYNLKRPLSKNDLIKSTSKKDFAKKLFNDKDEIKKNTNEILNNPKISSVVKRLSKI